MTVIASAVDTRSPAFRANAEAARALVADLNDKAAQIREGAGAA